MRRQSRSNDVSALAFRLRRRTAFETVVGLIVASYAQLSAEAQIVAVADASSLGSSPLSWPSSRRTSLDCSGELASNGVPSLRWLASRRCVAVCRNVLGPAAAEQNAHASDIFR